MAGKKCVLACWSILLILSGAAFADPPSLKGDDCAIKLTPDHILETSEVSEAELKQAWETSRQGLQDINNYILDKESAVKAVATAILSNEFVWMNGDPGGAKTYLARIMFKSELTSISDESKRVFILQFHKLLTEGKITGFPNFKKMLDDGQYEIETDYSLVSNKFLFAIFDEAEKANPATITSLLAVLNERKAFLGAKVVDAFLRAGVFTSNKTTAEFLDSFEDDRPSGEAILDRVAIKIHIYNQQLSSNLKFLLFKMVDSAVDVEPELALGKLQSLLDKVKIPDEVLATLSEIITQLDGQFTTQTDASLAEVRNGVDDAVEYFPANQFSIRSVSKILKVIKASFLIEQMMDEIEFEDLRFDMNEYDLALLSRSGLYNGPGEISHKKLPVKVEVLDPWKSKYEQDSYWNPYKNQITFRSLHDNKKQTLYVDFEKGTVKGTAEVYDEKAVIKQLKALEEEHKIDRAVVEYDDDGELGRAVKLGTTPQRTRDELEMIRNDRTLMLNQLRAAIDKEDHNIPDISKDEKKVKELNKVIEVANKNLAKAIESGAEGDELLKAAWESSQLAAQELRLKFVELDHYVNAIYSAILGDMHLYVFGPPGGAKTSLARLVLGKVLKNMNATSKGEFLELFFQQFHKLVPEGAITGFAKINEMMDSGKMEYNRDNSLANDKFIFAILDEVEKANPMVLVALLSVLNEREVFSGEGEAIRVALRTAVMTSNKLPSEFLDMFGDERPAGVALLDRTMNKVYVSNKFSQQDLLTEYLMKLEKGLVPELRGEIHLDPIKQLMDKVEVEDGVLLAATRIFDKYLARRVEASEKYEKVHRGDYATNPNYYIQASTASDRTYLAMFQKQWKAAFISGQLMAGVPFDEIKTKMCLKDISYLAQGLLYWGPYELKASYSKDGILIFDVDNSRLEALRNSSNVNERNKFMLNMINEEIEDFKDVANQEITTFLKDYREVIGQFPNLFPSIFAPNMSEEDRKQWIEEGEVL